MQKFINLLKLSLYMDFNIIIRGPAGVGKSAISKRLAEVLNGHYISYDDIMEEHKLDTIEGDGISSENFIKANNLVLPLIEEHKIVILDGCFYREKQLNHLLENLKKKVYIFTLKADIDECLTRNKKRKDPMTEDAIIEVYNLVSSLEKGINIDTKGKSIEEVVEEIISKISPT